MPVQTKHRHIAVIAIALCLVGAGGFFIGNHTKTTKQIEEQHAAAMLPFTVENLKIVLTKPGEDEPPMEQQVFNERLHDVATEGNALAQVALGLNYSNGHGSVQQNQAEAAKWFQAAAQQGRADAKLFLADAYESGRGVPQSDQDAFKWRLSAAHQGDETAQLKVGYAYALGKGVSKDQTAAEEWFKRSADQGNVEAQTSYQMAKTLREAPLRLMEKSLEESHQPSAGENTYIIKRQD